MLSSRKSSNLINKAYERSFRIVSVDNHNNFSKEITIHQRSLQVIMTETYKIINGMSPPVMETFFTLRENTKNFYKKYLMKIGKQ